MKPVCGSNRFTWSAPTKPVTFAFEFRWLRSAATPGLFTTSYRFNFDTAGFCFRIKDKGCPIPSDFLPLIIFYFSQVALWNGHHLPPLAPITATVLQRLQLVENCLPLMVTNNEDATFDNIFGSDESNDWGKNGSVKFLSTHDPFGSIGNTFPLIEDNYLLVTCLSKFGFRKDKEKNSNIMRKIFNLINQGRKWRYKMPPFFIVQYKMVSKGTIKSIHLSQNRHKVKTIPFNATNIVIHLQFI